jgi:hypothetical protein
MMNHYLHVHHPEMIDFDYSPENKDPIPKEYLDMLSEKHNSRKPYIDPSKFEDGSAHRSRFDFIIVG